MGVIDFELPPPPRRGDVLFRADDEACNANACLHPGNELPYLEGYRRGARHLAEAVCETGRHQDFLVYPIVYLYRHHVELALKRLLPLVAYLAGEGLSERCLKDMGCHRIDELWNNFKHLLNNDRIKNGCGLGIDPDDLAGIDSYIRQLSEIDPDAQAFRYNRRKTGVASLPEGLKHINIAVLADHMESLCTYLDCIDTQLDHTREIQDEMEAEYRNEMYAEYSGYQW